MATAATAFGLAHRATRTRARTRNQRGGRVALPFTAPFFILFVLFLCGRC